MSASSTPFVAEDALADPTSEAAGPRAAGKARRRILAAAIQVFGTYGFSKSTVQEIAVCTVVG